MLLKSSILEGIFNLLNSKLRSSLALLGVLVGTASVVAMVLGGELATNEALKQFKTLGTDLLAVTLTQGTGQQQLNEKESHLKLADALNMRDADPHILSLAPYTEFYSPLQFEGHEINGVVLGVSESFKTVINLKMEKGRFISDLDRHQFYCVIGNGLYEDIKNLTFKDPIGQQIKIDKNIFTIVGILKPWPENGFVYANIDKTILVPILASLTVSQYADIYNIILRIQENVDIDSIKKNIETYLNLHVANKHYYFRSAKELIAKMTKQSQILTVFLGLIGGISLLVGGIGVMNIMLVSVVERRREIGIRLAVGAKRRDIRALFLIEAVILSLIGGTLGVLIGTLIAYGIAYFQQWEFTLFYLPPLIGFSVSVLVGIFFGFYPAVKASRLDPIEALRLE